MGTDGGKEKHHIRLAQNLGKGGLGKGRGRGAGGEEHNGNGMDDFEKNSLDSGRNM
jgi:hypothetical protein